MNLIAQQDCSAGVASCRLTGGYMDCKGRILVCNRKERLVMVSFHFKIVKLNNNDFQLFDRTGKFLQYLACDNGFCRAQYIAVNSSFKAFVLDCTTKPHVGRLYDIVADPTLNHTRPRSSAPPPFYFI